MAATQRAAAKAVAKAEATRKRVPAQHKRGPGRPPKAAPYLEQVKQTVDAARHEPQRLSGQREPVTQRLRAIGQASHLVDVRREAP